MHLAIIAALIAFALKRPLGQKAAAIAGAFLIVLYCLLAGPMPSLYRAALMYLIGVAAIVYFLKRDSLSLLAMAFVIQIIATPAAGNSISFILSYLALAGILIAGEALNYIFRGKIPALLSGPLSASLGAFLLTAGVCTYFFAVLQPAGIVTGLILVPLTTVFMFGSIAWLLLDFITPWLSGLLGPVLSLLYDIMEKTVSLGARIPAVSGGFWPILIVSLVLSVGIVCCALWVQAARNRIPSFK
jgi:competence protein ComEC